MGSRALQYSADISDDEIDRLVAVPPESVDLSGVSAHTGADLLGNALARVVLPDAQTRDLIRQFLAMGHAHALAHLDPDAMYIRGLYEKQPWVAARRPAICFTGLQGVGKSELLHALGRIFSTRAGNSTVRGHPSIPLEPIWMMTLSKGDALNHLLREHVDPEWKKPKCKDIKSEAQSHKNWSLPNLLGAAEKRSWVHGTCLIAIDEFQWISASTNANARAATVLLKMHAIGPLLIYCANFSLVHKLKARPPEERDRLLSRPVIMRPFGPNSPEFTAYLAALQTVAPAVFTFDPTRDQEQVYLYTFGIRRKVVDLLVAAYRIACRAGGSGKVGAQELLLAYRSELYVTHREDVEVLFRQRVSGQMESATLWCPFGTMDPVRSNVREAAKIVQAFEKRMEDALLEAALMPAEAAALAVIEPDVSSTAKPAKVFRFRRGKATKDDLLAGAAVLDGID